MACIHRLRNIAFLVYRHRKVFGVSDQSACIRIAFCNRSRSVPVMVYYLNYNGIHHLTVSDFLTVYRAGVFCRYPAVYDVPCILAVCGKSVVAKVYRTAIKLPCAILVAA